MRINVCGTLASVFFHHHILNMKIYRDFTMKSGKETLPGEMLLNSGILHRQVTLLT